MLLSSHFYFCCLSTTFANDVKMVSSRSRSVVVQSLIYNVWNWLVNRDLSIHPNKCSYIAIGWAPPLQIPFAIGSSDDPIEVANVGKVLGVLTDNSSINCNEATFKTKRMLFMIRRPFAGHPFKISAGFLSALSKKVVLFNTSRKALEQASPLLL